MPRKPRGRIKRKTKLGVRCRNCRYVWIPDPRKWNGFRATYNNGRPYKVLYCPACCVRNLMPMEDVNQLIRWYKRHG